MVDDRVENENSKFISFGGSTAINVRSILDVAICEERVENDVSGNVIYQGWAVIGSAEDETVWLISKLNYDGNGFFSERVWAEGESTFEKDWTQRDTYNYSY